MVTFNLFKLLLTAGFWVQANLYWWCMWSSFHFQLETASVLAGKSQAQDPDIYGSGLLQILGTWFCLKSALIKKNQWELYHFSY